MTTAVVLITTAAFTVAGVLMGYLIGRKEKVVIRIMDCKACDNRQLEEKA